MNNITFKDNGKKINQPKEQYMNKVHSTYNLSL